MAFRKILWIFLVAASGIGVGACRKQQAAAPEEKMRVSVAYPQERAVTLYKEYPGYISSWNTVDIVARVSGYLQQSFFNSGALVKKGQLLFIIEPTLYEDAVEQPEAGVGLRRDLPQALQPSEYQERQGLHVGLGGLGGYMRR